MRKVKWKKFSTVWAKESGSTKNLKKWIRLSSRQAPFRVVNIWATSLVVLSSSSSSNPCSYVHNKHYNVKREKEKERERESERKREIETEKEREREREKERENLLRFLCSQGLIGLPPNSCCPVFVSYWRHFQSTIAERKRDVSREQDYATVVKLTQSWQKEQFWMLAWPSSLKRPSPDATGHHGHHDHPWLWPATGVNLHQSVSHQNLDIKFNVQIPHPLAAQTTVIQFFHPVNIHANFFLPKIIFVQIESNDTFSSRRMLYTFIFENNFRVLSANKILLQQKTGITIPPIMCWLQPISL